jgi:hypothetical protein
VPEAGAPPVFFPIGGSVKMRPLSVQSSCNVRSSSAMQSPRRLADGGPDLRTHTENPEKPFAKKFLARKCVRQRAGGPLRCAPRPPLFR